LRAYVLDVYPGTDRVKNRGDCGIADGAVCGTRALVAWILSDLSRTSTGSE